ncbi:MAG: hypothetical protein ACTSX8_01670, partial [Alphaproteobacteria bacterium]
PPSAGAVCDVVPSAHVEPLGPRKARVTYRFKVGTRNLEQITSRDMVLFVHFVNLEATDRSDGIVFQQDHKPKVSTRDWQPKSEVVDGPYELAIPEGVRDGRYEICLGLYDTQGRLCMQGNDDGTARYCVGAIIVEGDRVEFEPIPKKEPKGVKGRVNFAGKCVDFGEVVTAGMVIITPYHKNDREGILIMPNPRDESFEIGLRLGRIVQRFKLRDSAALAKATHADALDRSGNLIRRIAMQREGDVTRLQTLPSAASYLITAP